MGLFKRKDATDQPIVGFADLADAAFREPLQRVGFHPVNEREPVSNQYYDSRVYRNGDRYIEIYASTHYRDAPAQTRVHLGEGSLEWPEKDWNSIALWHLADRKDLYYIRDVNELPHLLGRMAADLNEVAQDFLTGDMKRFRHVRAEVTKSREPYTIHAPDEKGRYRSRIDEESAELKRRFERSD